MDEEPPKRVPDPLFPKKRRPVLLRLFLRWLLGIVLLAVVAGGVAGWAYLSFTAPGPLTAEKIYEIPKTDTREQMASDLQENGIISDSRIFSAMALANGWRGGKLKPGEYRFAAGTSMQDVLSMVTAGKVLLHKVSVPEGWTSQMVVDRLSAQPELEGTIGKTPDEGAILPDTYVFRKGLTREKLLTDMADAQKKLVDELWADRPADTPFKTKEDWIALASIVEKETGVPEERPKIASVFINRLKQNMRLQSDPTVIYGLVGGKGKLDHPLTKAELEADNPYNTYKNDGIPPGPIANPGRAALEATLHPDDTKYLYFVADGSGGHAFATTLDEHNANVSKWRKVENTNPPSSPPKPAATAEAVPALPNTVTTTPLPETQAAPAPAAQAPKLETPPPDKKPLVLPTAAPPTAAAPLVPGKTVMVDGKQVPIPMLKKPRK